MVPSLWAPWGPGPQGSSLQPSIPKELVPWIVGVTTKRRGVSAGLDKNVAELSTDLDSTSEELSAVLKGLDKLNEMCVAKAEPYAEKKARRESEIAGLKEALQILEGEAALLQKSAKHALRGVHRHLA